MQLKIRPENSKIYSLIWLENWSSWSWVKNTQINFPRGWTTCNIRIFLNIASRSPPEFFSSFSLKIIVRKNHLKENHRKLKLKSSIYGKAKLIGDKFIKKFTATLTSEMEKRKNYYPMHIESEIIAERIKKYCFKFSKAVFESQKIFSLDFSWNEKFKKFFRDIHRVFKGFMTFSVKKLIYQQGWEL